MAMNPSPIKDTREDLKTEITALNELLYSIALAIANDHMLTLKSGIRSMLKRDRYGIEIGRENASVEIEYFLRKVVGHDENYKDVLLSLFNAEISLHEIDDPRNKILNRNNIRERVQRDIDAAMHAKIFQIATSDEPVLGSPAVNLEAISGAEFEIYCEQVLVASGWRVYRKGGVGDQGVDILARMGNVTVAVQCKRYSLPVGNQAVQQIAAGKTFDNANFAAVVASGSFTKSAVQLAEKLDVLLINVSELPLLHKYLSIA